ncbi:MAG: DNA-directed RNA polymerase subunit omega [Oscillospiraceae bacterium]|nr:DNA-directed RNA polymerase subunit omega [Oscillospiraceae bacterium]
MMLYPALTLLTENISNRYLLVNVVARRARQIADIADANGISLEDKSVTIAINEVADGTINASAVDTTIASDNVR